MSKGQDLKKHISKQVPPQNWSNQWCFSMDLLAPKILVDTLLHFRFMKDIKMPKLPLHQWESELKSLEHFLVVCCCGLWSFGAAAAVGVVLVPSPCAAVVCLSRAYFILYVTHPPSPWFYSLFLFRETTHWTLDHSTLLWFIALSLFSRAPSDRVSAAAQSLVIVLVSITQLSKYRGRTISVPLCDA